MFQVTDTGRQGRAFAFLLGILMFLVPASQAAPQSLESEDFSGETIPEAIRRPQRGEAPRYPRDAVIGELGPGAAPDGAYRFARTFLSSLMTARGNSRYLADWDTLRQEDVSEKLGALEPRKFRIGGGREEADGSVSFLFRFISRDQGIAGELYLRQEEGIWLADDIILEEPQTSPIPGERYAYDFSPYERFY